MQYIVFLVGVCLCVFSHGASYNFLVGYSLSLGRIMSSDKLESFPIQFTGKNYSAWESHFKLFVKGRELWGHIDGSAPTPQGAEALSKWEIHDARVMTWILSSVESHLVLNLRPYKTVDAM